MPSAYLTKTCFRCGATFTACNRGTLHCSKRCGGITREGTPSDRLMAKIVKPAASEACWAWTGRVLPGPRSYGSLKVDGRETLAHRLMWTLTNGPIPEGLCVCHRCDNPPCCNPAHLFLGTKTDNTQDAIAKGRHVYSPKGQQNPNAKLTDEQVREIRTADGTARALAARYSVSPALIGFIRQRKAWRHLV